MGMKTIFEETCIYTVTYVITYCSRFHDILDYINSQKYLQSRSIELHMDIVLV